MNYWPANICNLAECEEPLFDLLERVAVNGARTAKDMYGCRGWCAHHNTDIWADTDPQDRWMAATLWPLGGVWLCTHVWERFAFSGDTAFLQRMFPVLRGCIEFLLDFLIEDETGRYLVTNPSLSPENTFVNDRGETSVFCEASTMDIQIITAVFDAYLEGIAALGTNDNDLTIQVRRSRTRLPPLRVGCLGQLLEWSHEYTELEPGHRHTSHLWALHPGSSITPSLTPDLASACDVVLRRRAEHGGGHTGWSRAWLINLHARLRQGPECKGHVEKLLKNSTLPNMLDDHPPFQIDGNFGGCAGILEMLLQSHEMDSEGRRVIRLMPAWPAEWREGSVRGMRARGGFEVGFAWEAGRIVGEVTVRSDRGTKAMLVFPDGRKVMLDKVGEQRVLA